MIRKADLLEAIDYLTVQVALQGDRIRDLERKFYGAKEKKKVAPKTTKQPRTKDGKFAKKK